MGTYNPSYPMNDMQQELQNISRAINEGNEFVLLEMRYAAPAKPRDGMVVLADGTTWNPSGLGRGFYGYYNGTWNKLG